MFRFSVTVRCCHWCRLVPVFSHCEVLSLVPSCSGFHCEVSLVSSVLFRFHLLLPFAPEDPQQSDSGHVDQELQVPGWPGSGPCQAAGGSPAEKCSREKCGVSGSAYFFVFFMYCDVWKRTLVKSNQKQNSIRGRVKQDSVNISYTFLSVIR